MLTPPDPATMAVSDADATPTDAPDTDALAPPVSQPGDAPPSDAPPNATEHAETPPDEEPLPAATSDPVGDAVSMAGAGSAGDIEIEDDAAVRAGPADDVQPEPSAIDVSQAAQPEPVAIDAVAPATQVEAEPEAEPEPVSALEALPDVAPMDESAPSATGTDAEPPIEAPPIAAPTTVAELVAATLRAAGVRLAFTVPGESFLPLLEALERADIRVVATRHEGAAAFAAEAYGQLTGRPAVCLGTRAVGAANLAIGIHTARADSAPMFVLVGQVPRAVRGREAFQEVDLVDTIGRLASWAVQIDEAGTAADLLGEAANRVLGGRPGPVLVALPEDVLDEPLPDGTRVPQVRPVPPRPEVDEVRRVLHALAGARRPVILAGGGVLRARCSNDLTRLAELLHVPVIASWRRADVMSNDHPLYLGMAGYFAAPTVRSRLDDADLVVVLGSRLNEITTFGYQVPRAGQRWIHVDVEPQRDAVGDRPAPEMVVEADAKAFVKAALTRLRSAVLLAEPLLARDTANAEDRAAWETAGSVDGGTWKGPGVHPGRVIATLRRVLADDGIVTTDAGNFGGWAARGFRFRRPGTFLGPTSGAMGYGLPAAIAASLAHRDRHVVALVGDGGLGMTLAEIETAVREHARVVVLVFDNERYGTIRMHQERRASGSAAATDLGPVDFAAIARACGARGVRVETDEAFEPQLRSALVSDRPTVLQLVLDRRWVSVDDRPAIEAAPPAG